MKSRIQVNTELGELSWLRIICCGILAASDLPRHLKLIGEGVEIPSSSAGPSFINVCRVCSEGAECDCREMPVLAKDKESKKAAGKCDAQEMCPLTLEMCRRRGAWNPGVRTRVWRSGRSCSSLRVTFLRLVIFLPFLSPVCTDVRSSHRLPFGRKQGRNWESGGALVVLVELDFDWV